MKRVFGYTIVCAALVFALGVRVQGQEGGGAVPAGASVEETSLRLKGADGKTYDVGEMRGQVVLVSFGATWCQPCQEELKALEELKKEYKDRGVKFLWVSIESEDEVSDSRLRDYAKKLKLSFPVLRDPDKSAFARFSARMRLPTILFFDRAGRLSLPNHVGITAIPRYMADLRARLDKLVPTTAATDSSNR
ncbi:MAG TPA: TlpA disulfide reductase family protein [Pyrinomonadaceae bacterium]|nr:TlpA disulfide reductase family protein [Pyrinomonadaceae bacterium]